MRKKCRKGGIMQALYVTPTLAGYFKSSIFVVQKATAPKNGVEFRQGSIGTIRSSLATSYHIWRRRQFSTNQRPRNYLTHTHTYTHTHRIDILSGPALRAAPAKILNKVIPSFQFQCEPSLAQLSPSLFLIFLLFFKFCPPAELRDGGDIWTLLKTMLYPVELSRLVIK